MKCYKHFNIVPPVQDLPSISDHDKTITLRQNNSGFTTNFNYVSLLSPCKILDALESDCKLIPAIMLT